MLAHSAVNPYFHSALSVAFVESRFNRICDSAYGVLLVAERYAVDEQVAVVGKRAVFFADKLVDLQKFAVAFDAREPLVAVDVELCFRVASFGDVDSREYRHPCPFRIRCHRGDYVLHCVFFHQFAGNRGIRLAYAGEKQPQVVVDFSRSAYCASRVAGAHFLFYGDCRRQPFDVVAFRFLHLAQELPGVGRQAFHIPPLPFGIESVERQR